VAWIGPAAAVRVRDGGDYPHRGSGEPLRGEGGRVSDRAADVSRALMKEIRTGSARARATAAQIISRMA
jgi:hypothetical protein